MSDMLRGSQGVKKKNLSKGTIVIVVVLGMVAIAVFALISATNDLGIKVVAQVEFADTYMQKFDSIRAADLSVRNAAIEALVNRDEENKVLKQNDSLRLATNDSLQVRLLIETRLNKEKDDKIDSLHRAIDGLQLRLRRSPVEDRYNE